VTYLWYMTLYHPVMYYLTKFGDPATNRIKDMLQKRFSFDVLKMSKVGQ